MSLRTLGDIENEVLVRLGAQTTNAYYTDAILTSWISQANKWAGGIHRWPMVVGTNTTTWSASQEAYLYPEGWINDSIRILQVGSKRLQRYNYEDYLNFREDNSSSQDKVYGSYGNQYFINPNIDTSGTIQVWGRFVPAHMDATDPNSLTIFSDTADQGNQAIVEEVLSYASVKENDDKQAVLFHKTAMEILESLWKTFQDEQYTAQSSKDRGMWKRFNVITGLEQSELFRRDQFF